MLATLVRCCRTAVGILVHSGDPAELAMAIIGVFRTRILLITIQKKPMILPLKDL